MAESSIDRLFLLLFPLLWCLVCVVIAVVGGWQALAGHYRTTATFHGRRWRLQSARMRWAMGYNNCLTIGANESGLLLAILFPFRPGHPPLFVPWTDITVGNRTVWLFHRCRLEFARNPGVPLTISSTLADKLRLAAGTAWPRERIEPT